MSSPLPSQRDPILDENEQDWITTRFIEGWSHGFMQMVTLLPKVRQFFDLTADWALHSFAREEERLQHIHHTLEQKVASSGAQGHESTSEKEDEVLSFKPRRRGSRTASPVPAAAIRSQIKESLSSSSSGSDNALSTPATSLADSDSSNGLPRRRASPSEGKVSGGPVQRLLKQEFEDIPTSRRRSSDSSPSDSSPSRAGDGVIAEGQPVAMRRASDSLEKGITGTAFVEAADLLKRRREEAVQGLGSALVTSDEERIADDSH